MNHTKRYEFVIPGIDKSIFTVANFKGIERVSSLYTFTIVLLSSQRISASTSAKGHGGAPASNATTVHFKDIVNHEAVFSMFPPGGEKATRSIYGIVEQFEFLQYKFDHFLYKATLRPKPCRMTKTHSNVIFLNKTLSQILQDVFTDSEMTPLDYQIAIANTDTAPHDYVCMFNESPFNFISQRMEHSGVYYFFQETPNGEKMVITDHNSVHPDALKDGVSYGQPWSPDAATGTEVVHSFHERQHIIPKSVIVRDYNYEHANIIIEGTHDIEDDNAQGTLYFYGEYPRTVAEAQKLAQIRAEEQLCRQLLYNGASSVMEFRPGHTFTLQDHPMEEYDRDYLITEVQHSGHQMGHLRGTLGLNVDKSRESEPEYANTFICQDDLLQFRPERLTKKSRFHGIISAVVDGSGSDGRAYLDDKGRYTVIMPFDQSGRKDGKASCPLRLMHPYAGKNVTFHFPLLKGSEVLVAFIDGDPDRPVIAGAVHNSETPSPVTSKHPYLNTIQTMSKQEILISDAPGHTYTAVGSSEKKTAEKHDTEEEGFGEFRAGSKYEITFGNDDSLTLGNKIEAFVGTSMEMGLGPKFDMGFGPSYSYEINVSKAKRKSLVYDKVPDVKPSDWSSSMLGSYLLPMSVEYSDVDFFEFGDASSYEAKDSTSSLGQKEASLFGGTATEVKDSLEQVSSKITKLVALAALGGTAISLAEGYGSYKLGEAGQLGLDNNLISNSVATTTGCLLPAAVAVKANKLLTTVFKNAQKLVEEENLIGGMIKCSESGVEIQANNPLTAPNLAAAKVNISTVGNEAAGEKAFIQIASRGESITLKRGSFSSPDGFCEMEMKATGLSITSNIDATNYTSLQLTGSSMKASLFPAQNGLSIGAASLDLWIGATKNTQLSLAETTAELKAPQSVTVQSGESSCKISPESVDFSVGGSTFVTNSSGITHTAANVRINGQIVDIG